MSKPGKRRQRMIAPIVITLLLILYLAGYLAAVLCLPLPLWVKILGGLAAAALAGALIAVTAERIHEIRSGETDDLDNY
ncbi:MAG: hypothetical protein SOV73_02475 [Candidatus Faecivivens sp.]|nr:hypothetical protein [Candidatus Faecivivens sp.]